MTVCGDGEFIVYTALAWRNKSFGQALEFAWSADSNEYVVRESANKVKIFKNFQVGGRGMLAVAVCVGMDGDRKVQALIFYGVQQQGEQEFTGVRQGRLVWHAE